MLGLKPPKAAVQPDEPRSPDRGSSLLCVARTGWLMRAPHDSRYALSCSAKAEHPVATHGRLRLLDHSHARMMTIRHAPFPSLQAGGQSRIHAGGALSPDVAGPMTR
jgi:hypothetical protein